MNGGFRIDIIKNIKEAQKLWNLFSPNQTLWENWDFRYCFYKYFNYELFFYLGYLKDKPMGLMPLQYDSDKDYLEFFGGEFMEENQVFIRPGMEELIPNFYQNIQNTNLKCNLGDISNTNPNLKLELDEYKYIYNLSGLSTPDQVLTKYLKPKRRKNKQTIFQELNEQYRVKELINNYDDLDLMISLNIKNFKSESSFNLPHRIEIFRDLLNWKKAVYLITLVINEKKQAVSFAIKHKNQYVFLNSGANKKEFPDLGSYLTYKNIEQAINAESQVFDACSGDCGWKEMWHFEKIPQFKFVRGI